MKYVSECPLYIVLIQLYGRKVPLYTVCHIVINNNNNLLCFYIHSHTCTCTAIHEVTTEFENGPLMKLKNNTG